MAVWFLVDVSESLRFATARPDKREVSAEVVALLALSAARNGDRVGALLFTDRVERRIPPRRGAAQVWGIVEEILRCEPRGTRTDLEAPLRELKVTAKRRSVVFLLSDFRAEGYERALRAVGRRHDLTGFAIFDPGEDTLPLLAHFSVTELESGLRTTVSGRHPATREAWRQSAEDDRRDVASRLRAAGADAGQVWTQESALSAVLAVLAARNRRRTR